MQNGKRERRAKKPAAPQGPAGASGVSYDEKMLEHVRMMTSLFEGRKVSRREVLEMLAREEKRQQGIGGGEKIEYRTRDLNEDSS
jgi:hypothetical protein